MTKELLDEREFELINILGTGEGDNQRNLADKMGLSLGMVNMLIRRLVTKGIIRITQLNKKKMKYILTPKGFSEKMQKSVKYTIKTINSIGIIRLKLDQIVSQLCDKGKVNFVAVGEHDLLDLLEISFKQNFVGEYSFKRVDQIPAESDGSIVLICKENIDEELPGNVVNIIQELAKE